MWRGYTGRVNVANPWPKLVRGVRSRPRLAAFPLATLALVARVLIAPHARLGADDRPEPVVAFLTPLCPAGHLPLKGGDRIAARLFRQRVGGERLFGAA